MEVFDRRQPHQQILKMLCQIDYEGERPRLARVFLDIEGFEPDVVERAVDDLLEEDVLVEDLHPILGERMIGIKDIIEPSPQVKS